MTSCLYLSRAGSCRDDAAAAERQRRWKGLSLIAAVAVLLWNVPPPLGISSQAWHLFTIFVSTMSAYQPRKFFVSNSIVWHCNLNITMCMVNAECKVFFMASLKAYMLLRNPCRAMPVLCQSCRRDMLLSASSMAFKDLIECPFAVGIITQPLPSGAVALAALGATVLTKTLSFQAAFSSFGGHTMHQSSTPQS